jgi:hypothetical protein
MIGVMPALTRRRDLDVSQETWRTHYGDVHVGTIAECIGNPGAAPELPDGFVINTESGDWG